MTTLRLACLPTLLSAATLAVLATTGCSDLRDQPGGAVAPAQSRDGGPDGPLAADGPEGPGPMSTPGVDGPPAPPPPGPDGGPPADPSCPAGQHRCPGGCVENASPLTCGTACEPCPGITGGTATCDGARCGVTCPAGSVPCRDACIPEGSPCAGMCPQGQNLCGQICVPATSLASCGPACLPCPTSDKGTASCDGETCSLTCNAGFHRCGETCLPDDALESCGDRCAPCEAPPGGVATCSAGKCGFSCPKGRVCGGRCVGASEVCDGACGGGFELCQGVCVPASTITAEVCDGKDNDCDGKTDEDLSQPCSSACGSGTQRCVGGRFDPRTCTAPAPKTETCDNQDNDCDGQRDEGDDLCPAPKNGTGVCRSGTCERECPNGIALCAGGMDCPLLIRDWRAVEGADVHPVVNKAQVTNLRVTTHGGAGRVFAADVVATDDTGTVAIRLPVCGGSITNLAGLRLTMQVRIDGPALAGSADAFVMLDNPGAPGLYTGSETVVPNAWTSFVDMPLDRGSNADQNLRGVGVIISLGNAFDQTPWRGTVYIDDVQLR